MTLFPERFDKKPPAAAKTFSERVIELALSIPAGKVSTYGAIAKAAGGGSMAARSVNGILGKAWNAGEHKIPFHRIVYSDGTIWLDDAYDKKRMALYKNEAIEIEKGGHIKDFQDKLYEF